MKRLIALFVFVVILCGCSENDARLSAVDQLRHMISQGSGVSFDAQVTAYYPDGEFTFSLRCDCEIPEKMDFRVIAPLSIKDIGGSIDLSGGSIKFDEVVLGFPLVSQYSLSPVCAPWMFIRALTDGYVRSSIRDDGGVFMVLVHALEGEEFRFDIKMSDKEIPESCEIYFDGQRILTLLISEFHIK